MDSAQIAADPAKAEARRLWSDAVAAFRRRDYPATADLLGRLTDGPLPASGLDEGMVRLQYGVTLLRVGRTEEGVEQLRRAAALDPSSARAHLKLGAGLGRLGRDLEALPWIERAVELEPGSAENHWRLGEQYRRLGRTRAARRAFERALQIDPADVRPVEGLQRLDRARGSWLARLMRPFRKP